MRGKMLSRVNLVAILLILNYVVRATEHAGPPQVEGQQPGEERDIASGSSTVLRYAYGNVTSTSPVILTEDGRSVLEWLDKAQHDDGHLHDGADSKIGVEERDRPRKRKRRMDRAVLALLMAYKLKFIALIPTIVGGLILLKGTTLLAGFFFALFAAVLGLKIH